MKRADELAALASARFHQLHAPVTAGVGKNAKTTILTPTRSSITAFASLKGRMKVVWPTLTSTGISQSVYQTPCLARFSVSSPISSSGRTGGCRGRDLDHTREVLGWEPTGDADTFEVGDSGGWHQVIPDYVERAELVERRDRDH